MASETFEAVLDEALGDPRVERSQMMGFPCAKVNGKIFVSDDAGALVLKLPRERVEQMIAGGEGEPFDPLGNGRVMKQWVRVPNPGDDAVALADEAREFVAGGG